MIGIIGAMQIEIDGLRAHMKNAEEVELSGIKFLTGEIKGTEVVMAVCGMGKVYAAICAQTMVIHFKVDAVINTGVAGNLSDKLGIKSVAIANQVVQHDMDLTPIGYQYGELGGLDLLVNNAGVTVFQSILDLEMEETQKMLNLDLLNYLVLSSKAARYMKAHEVKGCIINITSSRAERAYPGDCVYGGIKAAVNRASQSMALDLAPYGIRVNCVAPGAICIRTPEEIKAEGRTELEGFWESLGERIPMGRNGTPKDIGRAVVFLASENAAYITGEVLRVDGGLILPGMPEKVENDKNAWGGEK